MAVEVPALLGPSLAKARPGSLAVPYAVVVRIAVLQARQAGEALEGGGGRVEAGDAAVGERVLVLLVYEPLPGVRGDAADELGGVVGGGARHGDDLARVRVQAHDGAGGGVVVVSAGSVCEGLLQGLLCDLLDLGVDGETHVVALDGADGVHGAHDVAGCVDLDTLDAAVSLQVALEGLLGAVLAHDVAALVAVGAVGLGKLLLADGARIAQHVGCQGALRVGAHGARLHMHAGEGLGVLGDVGDGALVDVERDEAVCLSTLCGAARQLRDGLARDAQHVGEAADDLLVGLLVCADEHGERRAIAHQLDSVAVEDAPARGHGRVLGDAVLLGFGAVVLAADDLHGPQLDEERAQTHAGQPHEGEEAAAHV